MKNVIIVDHGKTFGHDHWYTFYCPYCGKQITRHDNENSCKYCGESIKWKD